MRENEQNEKQNDKNCLQLTETFPINILKAHYLACQLENWFFVEHICVDVSEKYKKKKKCKKIELSKNCSHMYYQIEFLHLTQYLAIDKFGKN